MKRNFYKRILYKLISSLVSSPYLSQLLLTSLNSPSSVTCSIQKRVHSVQSLAIVLAERTDRMGIVAASKDGKKDRCEWNGIGLAGTRSASEPLETGEKAGKRGRGNRP